jgi:excinuclease ABC subunit C
VPQRGSKRRVVEHAQANAREALARRMAENASQRQLLDGVAQALGLDSPPSRIEVYDNSHIQGRHAYGCMIVAGPDGFIKNAYRKFSIGGGTAKAKPQEPVPPPAKLNEPADSFAPAPLAGEAEATPAEIVAALPPPTGGDDYAMMREVMERRFARALKEDPERERGTWPDLVMLDGGQGQLNSALEVFAELGIDDVPIVAIAKGPDRDAGHERFFMPGKPPFGLEPKDPVLYFLQRLRDEAHRFAIGTHRAKRSKQIGHSLLDEVSGIGAKRKKALLLHFGSAAAVARAGLTDLMQVEGISETVAKKIYDHFQGQ